MGIAAKYDPLSAYEEEADGEDARKGSLAQKEEKDTILPRC